MVNLLFEGKYSIIDKVDDGRKRKRENDDIVISLGISRCSVFLVFLSGGGYVGSFVSIVILVKVDYVDINEVREIRGDIVDMEILYNVKNGEFYGLV